MKATRAAVKAAQSLEELAEQVAALVEAQRTVQEQLDRIEAALKPAEPEADKPTVRLSKAKAS